MAGHFKLDRDAGNSCGRPTLITGRGGLLRQSQDGVCALSGKRFDLSSGRSPGAPLTPPPLPLILLGGAPVRDIRHHTNGWLILEEALELNRDVERPGAIPILGEFAYPPCI